MNPTTELDTATEAYATAGDAAADALWIDVRRRALFDEAATMLPGARWCDPADVAAWQAALPRDRPVLVYCVHGHAVSRGVVLQLRAAGVDGWFLRGGIDGWLASGRPVQVKEASS